MHAAAEMLQEGRSKSYWLLSCETRRSAEPDIGSSTVFHRLVYHRTKRHPAHAQHECNDQERKGIR